MPFKLSIRGKDETVDENAFSSDQSVVTIGRQKTAGKADVGHLYLPDEHRVLSRVHARIEAQKGVYSISDLSENGTWLDDEPLKRGKSYALANDNKIRLGEYTLTFSSGAGEETRSVRRTDLLFQASRLFESLNQVHQTYADYDDSQLRQAFHQELEREIKQMTSADAIETFALLRGLVRESKPGWARAFLDDDSLQTEILDPELRKQQAEQALEALTMLKHRLVEQAPSFRERDLRDFCGQVQAVMQPVLGGLLRMLKARREFADGLDADVTRMLELAPNPLKGKNTAQGLTAYLLTWIDRRAARHASDNLKDAIRDLEMHQVASLAALRHVTRDAYASLISRLAPGEIDKAARAELPGPLKLLLPIRAWRKFKETYEREKDIGLQSWSREIEDKFVERYMTAHAEKQNSNGEE